MRFELLSRQERLCLALLHEFGSAQAVANQLGLALSTVYNHHQRAMKKLGAPSALRAAQLYAAYLSSPSPQSVPLSESFPSDDSRIGNDVSSVVFPEGIATPSADKESAGTLREERAPFGSFHPFPQPSLALELRPWRGKGERDSRLNAAARLGWIVGVACLVAITVLVLVSVGVSLTLIRR